MSRAAHFFFCEINEKFSHEIDNRQKNIKIYREQIQQLSSSFTVLYQWRSFSIIRGQVHFPSDCWHVSQSKLSLRITEKFQHICIIQILVFKIINTIKKKLHISDILTLPANFYTSKLTLMIAFTAQFVNSLYAFTHGNYGPCFILIFMYFMCYQIYIRVILFIFSQLNLIIFPLNVHFLKDQIIGSFYLIF